MVNFGFHTIKSDVVDLDSANFKLANSIKQEETTFCLCISCGSCTATCTSGKFNGFSFREMCQRIRIGDVAKALEESGKCMLCGKCTLVCPRNINTRNILRIVRKEIKN
jgi:heterodisulfide reductase subunit C